MASDSLASVLVLIASESAVRSAARHHGQTLPQHPLELGGHPGPYRVSQDCRNQGQCREVA